MLFFSSPALARGGLDLITPLFYFLGIVFFVIPVVLMLFSKGDYKVPYLLTVSVLAVTTFILVNDVNLEIYGLIMMPLPGLVVIFHYWQHTEAEKTRRKVKQLKALHRDI